MNTIIVSSNEIKTIEDQRSYQHLASRAESKNKDMLGSWWFNLKKNRESELQMMIVRQKENQPSLKKLIAGRTRHRGAISLLGLLLTCNLAFFKQY